MQMKKRTLKMMMMTVIFHMT